MNHRIQSVLNRKLFTVNRKQILIDWHPKTHHAYDHHAYDHRVCGMGLIGLTYSNNYDAAHPSELTHLWPGLQSETNAL